MPVHVHIKMPDDVEHKRGPAHHDDSHGPAGWAKHREPLEEKRISSLTAGAGHDKWARRAEANSGPKTAPGIGTKKSSQ